MGCSESNANESFNSNIRNGSLEPIQQNKKKEEYLENYEKGMLARNIGQYFESIEYFDKAISLNPSHLDSFFNKGLSLIELDKNREAIVCFDKCLELHPNLVKAMAEKGYSYDMLGEDVESLKCYEDCIRLDNNNSTVYYYKGCLMYKLMKSVDAIFCLKKALELQHSNEEDLKHLYLILGYSLYENKNYQEAVKYYDKLDDDAKAFYNKGLSLNELKRFKESAESFKKCIELDPNFEELEEAYLLWGGALFSIKEYNQAIQVYDKFLKIPKTSEKIYYNKGATYFYLNRFEDAIECYERSIQINSYNSEYYLAMAAAYEKLGDEEKANECHEKANAIQDEQNEEI